MSEVPGLHPLGAARVRFLSGRGDAVPGARTPAVHSALGFVPPVLVQRLRELGLDGVLALAADLASLPGVPDDDRPATLWLAAALLAARADGGTRLLATGTGHATLDAALERLGAGAPEKAAVHRVVESQEFPLLSGEPGHGRPIVREGPALALDADDLAERRLAAAVHARRRTASPIAPDLRAAALDLAVSAAAARGRPLDADQAAAVALALRSSLAVVSGGPGTGKTTIVVSLLRALVHAGVGPEACLLAAPTGKAAHRLSESIRAQLDPAHPLDARLLAYLPDPATLHRLLGYAPSTGRFRHHAGHPLPARVVCVDEASMIDLPLADHLLRAVGPGTLLVLLGDAHQLPSVERGAVLRDLVTAGASGPQPFVARLTRSHRMREDDPNGSRILRFANAVNSGRFDESPTARPTAPDVRFEGVELLPSTERRAVQQRWFDRLLAAPALRALASRTFRATGDRLDPRDTPDLRAAFRDADRRRVLCALREPAGGAGMADWNDALHDRYQRLPGVRRGPTFLPGEPAIATRNDHDRDLFNGDVGLVLDVSFDGAPARLAFVVDRNDGPRAHPLEFVRDGLELAWALTIHRAQGSEFDEVLLALPDTDTPVWTRELLYTAVTRARRGVLLVGAEARLASAPPAARVTGLAALLAGTSPPA